MHTGLQYMLVNTGILPAGACLPEHPISGNVAAAWLPGNVDHAASMLTVPTLHCSLCNGNVIQTAQTELAGVSSWAWVIESMQDCLVVGQEAGLLL